MSRNENLNLRSIKPQLQPLSSIFLVLRYSHVAGFSFRNEFSPTIGRMIFPGAWADSDNRHRAFQILPSALMKTTGNYWSVFYLGPEKVPVKLLWKVIRNSSAQIGNCSRKKSGFCAGIPISLNAYERLSS